MRRNLRSVLGEGAMVAYLMLFFIFLESPLAIIILASFNDGPTVAFPPSGFSIQWYRVLWDMLHDAPGFKPGLASALWTSVWLGFVSMIGAVVAGVLAAFGIQRFEFPGKHLVRQAFVLPLLFPQVVTGIGLVLWFSQIGGVPTWMRLVVGHLILTIPYVLVTTIASLEMQDIRLDEAAMNLGANRVATFRYITIPGIQSGIISGAIFAWLTSFSNFTVTFFLYSGELQPFPPWLFEVMEYFIDPSIAALSTFLVLITLVVMLTINRMFALSRLVGLHQ